MERYPDKKENKIFLRYKEFSNGIGCKVIYEEGLPNVCGNVQKNISPYMRSSLVICDFAPDPSEFPYISFLFYQCRKIKENLVNKRQSKICVCLRSYLLKEFAALSPLN